MKRELLDRLACITEEERRLLEGEGIDKELYAKGRNFEVDAGKLLEKGRLITLRPHTRFAAFPRHSHNYVEIMYMCAGSTVHVVNGEAPVTLQEGELLFLNQHASHAIRRAEAGDIAVNFIVLPQFFDFAFEMIGTENVLGRFLLGTLQDGGQEVRCLHCKTASLLPVQDLVESMVWNLLNKEPNSRRINQVSMALLLMQLLNHPECLNVQGEAACDSPLVLAALREIEENCRGASMSQVAARFGVSPPYLSARVKAVTGHTFKELLQQKRLDKAQRLLRDTKLSVQAVCSAVGYETTSYFYSIYKKQFGITPKEYRRRLCKV